MSILGPSQPVESFSTRLLRAGFELDKAVTPYLCLFGALGNSLSLAIFSLDRKYRRQSSTYYLSTLAISDTGFLINLFLLWFESVYGGVITSAFTCRLVMYLGQVTCFISIYVIVGFSIERYVAVRNPLSKQHICTTSRAKKGIIGVICTALLIFSYVWIIAQLIRYQARPIDNNKFGQKPSSFIGNAPYGPQPQSLFDYSNQTNSNSKELKPLLHYCSVPKQYHHISKIANYLDTIFTLIIPFALILFCNVNIVLALKRLRKDRQLFLSPPTTLLVSNKTKARIEHPPNPSKKGTLTLRRCKSDGDIASTFVPADFQKYCKRRSSRERQTIKYRIVCTSNPCSSEARATNLLLLVSSIFLMLNLPLHVIRCAQFVQSLTGSNKENDVFGALQPWANLLFNTNFALNFVLYCVSGGNFRRSVKEMVLTILCRTIGKTPTQHRTTAPCVLKNKRNNEAQVNCKVKRNGRRGGSL